MSIARRLIGDAGIYGVAAALSSLVGIILVPLYARTFAPAQYGVISLINSTNTLATILAVCALDNSAAVWYWDKRQSEERSRTFSSWFFTSAAIGAGITAVLLLLYRPFADIVLGGPQYRVAAVLLACAQTFWALPRVGNLWFRNERRPAVAVSLALIASTTTAVCCVTFVTVFHWGIAGVAAGQLAGGMLAASAALIALRRVVRVRSFDPTRARQMVRFSSPLVISGLFAWCMGPAAPYVLTAAGLRADAGLFQVGSSLASVAGFVVFAFCQAWTPFALEISLEERAARVYATVTEVFLAGGLVTALFVHAAAADLLRWITGPRYVTAGHAATALVLTQVVAGLPQIFGVSFTIAKRVRPLAWATAFGATATTIGFALLVRPFERDGAALAVLLGACCSTAYAFWASQRAFRIPIDVRRTAFVVVGFLVSAGGVTALGHASLGPGAFAIARCLVVLGFALAVAIAHRAHLQAWRLVKT